MYDKNVILNQTVQTNVSRINFWLAKKIKVKLYFKRSRLNEKFFIYMINYFYVFYVCNNNNICKNVLIWFMYYSFYSQLD